MKRVSQVCDVIGHVSMCASVLMIVALTLERHFAICNPHKYRIHMRTTAKWKHLAMYVGPVSFLALFLNIPLFINLQRRWMKNALYVKINLYLRAIHPLTSTGLLPFAVLIILNVRICRGIQLLHQRRTSRNRKELNLAYIAIVIVSLFVISNVPRIFAGALEVTNTQTIIRCIENNVQYIPTLFFYQIDFIARMLMVFNSSINFLIYCTVSAQFKNAFYRLVIFPICHLICKSKFPNSGSSVNGSQRNNQNGNGNGNEATNGVDSSGGVSNDMNTYGGLALTTTTAPLAPITEQTLNSHVQQEQNCAVMMRNGSAANLLPMKKENIVTDNGSFRTTQNEDIETLSCNNLGSVSDAKIISSVVEINRQGDKTREEHVS